MKKQKTHVDLYGLITKDHKVDGCYIVKRLTPMSYRIVCKCESKEMANTVFNTWENESKDIVHGAEAAI